MNEVVSQLRERLASISPYPKGCVGLDGKPTMNGTAFFPGGDGLWKAKQGDDPEFPFGGTLVLGSDFGDEAWFDAQFDNGGTWREETNGATWRGLLNLIDLAGIVRSSLFCTNAWPCLREGDEPVKGGIPGARDPEFTQRCVAFFKGTVEMMKPSLIVPLGIAPTRFVAIAASDELRAWKKASSWKQIDVMPVGLAFGARVVPVVHPSMPNRRHRIAAKTLAQEAALIRWSETTGTHAGRANDASPATKLS